MSKGRILIAEDERSIRSLLRTFIESEGYEVEEAANGSEALDAIMRQPPDVIILDLSMPAPQGMELLQRLRSMAIRPKPRVIVLTAYGSVPLAVQAMQLGALDFLEKPSAPEKIIETIKRVLGEKVLSESATAGGHEALLARARIAISDGDYAKAESLLMAAAPTAASDPAYYNLLGLWQEINGRFSEARGTYGRAIALNPNYEPARLNMRRTHELRETGHSDLPPNLGL
jgi:DNA-binding NtrC family response regulator